MGNTLFTVYCTFVTVSFNVCELIYFSCSSHSRSRSRSTGAKTSHRSPSGASRRWRHPSQYDHHGRNHRRSDRNYAGYRGWRRYSCLSVSAQFVAGTQYEIEQNIVCLHCSKEKQYEMRKGNRVAKKWSVTTTWQNHELLMWEVGFICYAWGKFLTSVCVYWGTGKTSAFICYPT